MKIIVSACLLGHNCKYNGGNNYDAGVAAFLEGKEIIPVCPEALAGLGIPRTPMEIVDGVLINRDGVNVDQPVRNAVAQILKELDGQEIHCAILKSRSPTCGVHQIYDGTFSGTLIPGYGVTAELLRNHGVAVFGESRLADLEAYLAREETP